VAGGTTSGRERRFWAPGRVNLIGEHTDYSGGLVLPAALDLGLTLCAHAAERVSLRSEGQHEGVEVPADGSGAAQGGWGRYVAAVVAELAARGRPAVGLEGALSSTLPAGTGLSSSAALEVVVATALCAVAELRLEPLELAALCQRAEHRAVGVPSGIMDQAASILGRAGHAVLLDCGTLEHRTVPLPASLALLVVDSGVRRALEGSGYAARRRELEQGLVALDGRRPSEVAPDEAERLARAAGLADVPARRLRHVVSENVRVREVVAALEAPDGPDLAALARLFAEGHRSLRDDFEVSTPELDRLVELALEAGAVAARMTGGGFGGAIVALVPAHAADRLATTVVERYAGDGRPQRARAYVCAPADGARELAA
jgi:galactokinase